MDTPHNEQMGVAESKKGIMPGTFPRDAEQRHGEPNDSGNSDFVSLVAPVAGRFNGSVATSNINNDTKLAAEKPHPFTFSAPTAADIKKIWEGIEVKKTRLQGFDALQIMSDLTLLEHANVSKEAILSCPIVDQVRDLQTHRIEKIAVQASVVLPRLESIVSPKQDPPSAGTFNKSAWKNTSWSLPLGVSTSRKIVATPSIFRDAVLRHAMNAAPSAELAPVPPSLKMPDTSARTNSQGIFSGLAGNRENMPLQSTNPPQEVDATAQTASQLPASGFAFPLINTAESSLLGSTSGATEKALLPNFSLERSNRQFFSESTMPLFGNTQPSFVFGSPTPSSGGVLQEPREQESSVNNTIADKNATPALFGETVLDVSKPSDANPSPDLRATPDIITYVDFIKHFTTSAELDEERISSWKNDLNHLWEEVTSAIDEIYNNGKIMSETNRNRVQLNKLPRDATVSYPAFLEHGEIEDGKLLDEYRRNKERWRSTLVGLLSAPLRKLILLDRQTCANHESTVESMMQDIEATESRLLSTKTSLEVVSKKLATVEQQLEKAEDEKIELKNREKSLERKYRKGMDRIIRKHAARLEDAHAQVSWQVNSQSAKLAKAMENVEDLQRQLKSLDQEKQDLISAKITREKEYEEFKATVENLRNYEKGYMQFKKQLEELQTSYNDVMFERDDLQQRLNAITTAETDEQKLEAKSSSSTSMPAAPCRDSQNPAVELSHLDGLIDHWENALKAKLASMEKTKEDISVFDAEIQKAKLTLSPRPAPRSLAVPAVQIVTRHRLLDTGMEPLPRPQGTPETAIVENANHTWSSVVKGRPGQ